MSSRQEEISQKQQYLQDKIHDFFENNYLDVQGLTPGISSLDEAYLARILTKLAIGSATVWWSLLEIKDFMQLRNKVKVSSYESSRTNPF